MVEIKFKISLLMMMVFLLIGTGLQAQIFISKAKIEYEVKSDIKKTMSNYGWEKMVKDKLPQFKTGYFTLTFANGKSLYQFDHWGAPKLPDDMTREDEENKYYYDYNSGKYNMRKSISGGNVDIADSIPRLKWKLVNENRIIAGFNCRKAVAILFDSVYVFAFYTEEIVLPGGPGSFQGLPGTILGVTVPRLYTSWVATKVIVSGVNVNAIKPMNAKKNITMNDFRSLMNENTKDWYSPDDPDRYKEVQQQKARFIWGSLL